MLAAWFDAPEEEERTFLSQWQERGGDAAGAELDRLEKIAATREVTLGASKRVWMGRRINLLKQLRMRLRPEAPKVEL